MAAPCTPSFDGMSRKLSAMLSSAPIMDVTNVRLLHFSTM